MTAQNAARLAARLLYEARSEAETLRVTLSPACLDLEVGDIISHDKVLWRLTAITYGRTIEVEAVRYHSGLYGSYLPASIAAAPPRRRGKYRSRPCMC